MTIFSEYYHDPSFYLIDFKSSKNSKGLNETHMIVHIYMSSQTFRRFRKDLLSNIILLVCEYKLLLIRA